MTRSILTVLASTTLFGACNPPDTYITEEGDRYVDIDVMVTPNDNEGETPTEEIDPCDVEFRAYAEDGSYVDLTLGGMPEIRVLTQADEIAEGSFPQAILEVTSHRGCGEVEILGVQALVRSQNGPIRETHWGFNALEHLDTLSTSHAIFEWFGGASTSVYKMGAAATWDSEWFDNFEPFVLEMNGMHRLQVELDAMVKFPPSQYEIEYKLRWRDLETGTVSSAYLEETVGQLVVTDDECLIDLPSGYELDGQVKAFAPPTIALSANTPNGSSVPGWQEVLRFNVETSSCGGVNWLRFGTEFNATDNAGTGWADEVPYVVRNYSTREILETGTIGYDGGFTRYYIGVEAYLEADTVTTVSVELNTLGASTALDDTIQLSLYGASWSDDSGIGYPRVSIVGTPTIGGILYF